MNLRQKITIFSLTFLLNTCWASSLEQKLALRDSDRLTSELVRLCTSTDPDRLAYCEGYIEGATHLWKLHTACASLAKNDLSFCAGAINAREKFSKALEACKDCDMTRSPDDLKIIMGVCKPGKYHDEHYCSGYNSETVNSIAFFSVPHLRNINIPRNLGLSHAASDVGVQIMGNTGEFLEFQPCVQIAIAPKQVRKILLEFVRENPELQVNSSAIMILEKALFYDFCPGPTPQRLKPHLENCIKWASTRRDSKLGWRNICNKAVVIEFHSYLPGKPGLNIERQVIPGKTSTKHPRHSGGKPSLFTVCPVGYVSSVPFTEENRGDIRASRYSCIRK